MRTLGEIIECIKGGGDATTEELYFSVLALEALSVFDSRALSDMAEKESKFLTPQYRYEESWNRWKRALGKSPQEWVGWNNDPHNPECQKRRQFHKQLADKVIANMAAEKEVGE